MKKEPDNLPWEILAPIAIAFVFLVGCNSTRPLPPQGQWNGSSREAAPNERSKTDRCGYLSIVKTNSWGQVGTNTPICDGFQKAK
jgi:hypothetical protein